MNRREIRGPAPEAWGSRVILWGLGLSLAISALIPGKIGEGPDAHLQLLLLLLLASHLALRLRATRQRSRGAGEQGSRGAEGQGSRGAEEQEGRGMGERGSRGAGEQRSKKAEEWGSGGVGEQGGDELASAPQQFRTPAPPHPSASAHLTPFYPLAAVLALGLLSLASTVNYALTVRHFHQWIGYGILAYLVACEVRPPGQGGDLRAGRRRVGASLRAGGTSGPTGAGAGPLIRLMVSLGGVLGLYGIYQHFWGFPHALAYLEATGEDPLARDAFQSGRVFSAFFSPDMLAGYLSMTIPLGLALLAGDDRSSRMPIQNQHGQPELAAPQPENGPPEDSGIFTVKIPIEKQSAPSGQEERFGWLSDRLLAAVSLVLMLGALYLTRSLGGWLSLLAALGLWGFIGFHCGIQSPERRRRYRAGLLALLLGGLVLAGTILWGRALYFFQFSHPDNSLVQRWHYWESAVHIAADFPLSGSGLGTFGLVYPHYKPAKANETQYTHNGYLQLAAELGLPGLVAFLWAIFVFLRRGGKAVSLPADRKGQLTALGLLAAGTAFLFHSLVDYGLAIPQVAFSWWAIFGLTVAQGQPAAGSRWPKGQGWTRAKQLDRLGLDSSRMVKVLQVALFLLLLGLVLSVGRELLGRHYYQEAREAVQKEQLEEADRAIRRAMALAPLDDAYHYFSARLSSDRMRQAKKLSPELLDQAVRGYGRAIELNPYYSFYYRDRGLFYLGLGQDERAIGDLSAAVALYPTNGSHRYHLGLAYKGRGDLKRAEEELREALRLRPDHGELLRELAWTLFSQRKPYDALPYFEQLARLHPREAQARVDLGWAYAGLGQHRRALEEYQAALQQNPRHVYAWVNRGWSFYQLKEYPRAEEAYRKALSLEPDNLDPRVNLVLLYLKTGEVEKARTELAEALRIAPRNPRLMRLRQELSKTRGNHE